MSLMEPYSWGTISLWLDFGAFWKWIHGLQFVVTETNILMEGYIFKKTRCRVCQLGSIICLTKEGFERLGLGLKDLKKAVTLVKIAGRNFSMLCAWKAGGSATQKHFCLVFLRYSFVAFSTSSCILSALRFREVSILIPSLLSTALWLKPFCLFMYFTKRAFFASSVCYEA